MTTDEHPREEHILPTEVVTGRGTSAQRDDSTRYLCAAAHLDPRFADNAIREVLAEPLRAILPSPAIDTATVLREAVAARSRRLLRDWSLLVLLILFAISGLGLAIAWLAFGLALSAAISIWVTVVRTPTDTVSDPPPNTRSGTNVLRTVASGGNVKQQFGVLVATLAILVGLPLALPSLGGVLGSTSFMPGPFSVLLLLLALIVVVLDKFALSYLLTRSFRRGSFVATPTVDTWPGERWVRTVGQESRERQLKRVAGADQTGNLVAYRGYRPFIGAGDHLEPVTMPIPLDPKRPDEDAPPSELRPFTLAELYDHVTAGLMELRDWPSLAPSGRLAGLTESPQAVVPVAELLVNLADPASRSVLPSLDEPPSQTIDADLLAELIEHPLEWLRYYRRFQLETWSRDVTVSMFLHFGVGERMLYLEWIPCVLYPISDEYRIVDRMPIEPLGPLRDGLVEWLRLPSSLLGRTPGMFRRVRPLRTRPGQPLPAKYGSGNSLRELAASNGPSNYFQDADIARYLQLLTGRMIRTIGQFLEGRGIEVTQFMAHAQEVGDQYTFNGPVEATSIGSRNRVDAPRKRSAPDKD
jgi:hypothetical protein